MPGLVADTHVIIWHLLDKERLSTGARRAIAREVACGAPICLPTVCLVEIVYLLERGRIPDAAWSLLVARLDAGDSDLRLVPLDRGVAEALRRVSREQVPDMPDRIIAATAVHLGLPLVTRDARIRAAGIDVVW